MEQGRQMRFSEDELILIKDTFKGNETLLKLLRKVFLPEYDPYAPLGQVVDLWLTLPIKEMNPQDAMVNIMARNNLISHIEQQLLQLKALAEDKVMTAEEIKEKRKKDSTK